MWRHEANNVKSNWKVRQCISKNKCLKQRKEYVAVLHEIASNQHITKNNLPINDKLIQYACDCKLLEKAQFKIKSVIISNLSDKREITAVKWARLWFLTDDCSCVFGDCSFTFGSASPSNTAGTNALGEKNHRMYISNLKLETLHLKRHCQKLELSNRTNELNLFNMNYRGYQSCDHYIWHTWDLVSFHKMP